MKNDSHKNFLNLFVNQGGFVNKNLIIKYDDENAGVHAVIDGKEWSVPLDTNNTHYQAIQAWVTAGNTITAAD